MRRSDTGRGLTLKAVALGTACTLSIPLVAQGQKDLGIEAQTRELSLSPDDIGTTTDEHEDWVVEGEDADVIFELLAGEGSDIPDDFLELIRL